MVEPPDEIRQAVAVAMTWVATVPTVGAAETERAPVAPVAPEARAVPAGLALMEAAAPAARAVAAGLALIAEGAGGAGGGGGAGTDRGAGGAGGGGGAGAGGGRVVSGLSDDGSRPRPIPSELSSRVPKISVRTDSVSSKAALGETTPPSPSPCNQNTETLPPSSRRSTSWQSPMLATSRTSLTASLIMSRFIGSRLSSFAGEDLDNCSTRNLWASIQRLRARSDTHAAHFMPSVFGFRSTRTAPS